MVKKRDAPTNGGGAVLSNSGYAQTVGHGWLSGTIDSRDRGSSAGNAVSRDFNFTQIGTFVVDVPAGLYDVTLTMGDGLGFGRDQMGVFLEGVQFDSVTTVGSQIAVNTYQVQVTDGQLTLLLDDLGGSDPWVLINGLDVVVAGSAQSAAAATPGPQASSIGALVANLASPDDASYTKAIEVLFTDFKGALEDELLSQF